MERSEEDEKLKRRLKLVSRIANFSLYLAAGLTVAVWTIIAICWFLSLFM